MNDLTDLRFLLLWLGLPLALALLLGWGLVAMIRARHRSPLQTAFRCAAIGVVSLLLIVVLSVAYSVAAGKWELCSASKDHDRVCPKPAINIDLGLGRSVRAAA